MFVDETKKITFETKSYEKWQEIASNSLKGLPFDKLISKTIEGIDLLPLYTEESSKLPSLHPIREAKKEIGWTVAQYVYAKDAKSFLLKMNESIHRGNEGIVYDGKSPIEWTEESLSELKELITNYPIYFYHVGKEDPILKVFFDMTPEQKDEIRGVVETIETTDLFDDYTNVRTIGANLIDLHHQGIDAVTELALALAYASEQAIELKSFKKLSERFFVRFAVDTHFFMEIAKLRAFRVLWEALSLSYEEKVCPVPLLTETSKRSFSTVDPYVNLLRAGNSAFSAVLGGADVLTVHPHDVLTSPTNTSIRLARNIQIVIKEETLVNEVMDPSGGSYFIESLTKSLVEKAWQQFIAIEEYGSYSKYITSEQFHDKIDQLYHDRVQAIAEGDHSLVGTSVYTDLTATDNITANISVDGRLAAPFEQFREIFKANQPTIGLLTFGSLKDFKQRADFVKGFLATGGLETISSPALETVEDAITWMKSQSLDYLIICATNERTVEVVPTLLKTCDPSVVINVAGKYKASLTEEWLNEGLDGFIYVGLNKIKKFQEILNRWKGEK